LTFLSKITDDLSVGKHLYIVSILKGVIEIAVPPQNCILSHHLKTR
jgi:hypothetical protein